MCVTHVWPPSKVQTFWDELLQSFGFPEWAELNEMLK
jgi:hypothetical protein